MKLQPTYTKGNNNILIGQSQSNTLLIYFSSKIAYEPVQIKLTADKLALKYYDKLYQKSGYNRTLDFWEVPTWTTRLKGNLWIVRNIDKAIEIALSKELTLAIEFQACLDYFMTENVLKKKTKKEKRISRKKYRGNRVNRANRKERSYVR